MEKKLFLLFLPVKQFGTLCGNDFIFLKIIWLLNKILWRYRISGSSIKYNETVKHLCNPLLSNCNKAKFADISCVIDKCHAWSAFWKLDRVWKSPASLQQKVKLSKASALSVILYGCESWVLTSDVCGQLDFFQTSCLRINCISCTDHVSNEKVYDRTRTVPLFPISSSSTDQIPDS